MSISSKEFKDLQRLSVAYEPWNESLGSLLGLHKSYKAGRIECYYDDGELIGYAESWRIHEPQILDILNSRFSVLKQNFTEGPVLWISNVTILPSHRKRQDITRALKKRIFDKNKDAQFVGGSYNGTRTRNKKYKIIPIRKKAVSYGIKER